MAFSTSPEYDDPEFVMFEYSKHTAHLCDVDLTCYESFYDFSPSKLENENIKIIENKSDSERIEMFENNESSGPICYCSRVPDIDYVWPDRDGSVHDVLGLYNIVRRELFGDTSPEDNTTCLSDGWDSSEIPTSPCLQVVPTSTDSNVATDSVQPFVDEERFVADSTDTDTQEDTDARVPSSCSTDILPSNIEE